MQSTEEDFEAESHEKKLSKQAIAVRDQQEKNGTDADILEIVKDHPTDSTNQQPTAVVHDLNTSPSPIKLPKPEDAKLEAKNGKLVLSWNQESLPESLEHEFIGTIYQRQGRKTVYEFCCKEQSVSLPEDLCDPTMLYHAEVAVKPIGHDAFEKSEPCFAKRKRLCEISHGKVHIDGSSRLRSGYDVYKGYFKGARSGYPEPIAVKLVEANRLRELKNLEDLTSTPHENIVTHRTSGKLKGIGKNVYIAMELCHKDTLHEIAVNGKLNFPDRGKVLVHMMRGLCYIHGKGILHRDLKPQNVLRSMDGRSIKLADFGFSKGLEQGMSTVSRSQAVGTNGWGSPEHYDDDTSKMSKASDIFSAGLVACFVLSNGKHAFGEDKNRWVIKIIDREPIVLPPLICNEPRLAEGMVYNMLEYDPSKRPSADQVLCHPFFWDNRRKLDFFHRVWEFLAPFFVKKNPKLTDAISGQIVKDLTEDKSIIITPAQTQDWHQKMKDCGINEFLLKKANGEIPGFKQVYQSDSVIKLIHFIRNIEEHFRQHVELKSLFQNERKNVWPTFAGAFPELLLKVYDAFYKHWPRIKKCTEFSDDLAQFFTTQAAYEQLDPFDGTTTQEPPKKRGKKGNS